jgi:hypothetical protein
MTKSFSTWFTARHTWCLMFFLGMPFVSLAQTNQTPWSNLSSLRPGQKIQILETNSKKHSGSFLSVSDTAISSRESAREQTLLKPEVRSVKVSENSRRMLHILIGTGVGAGAGAAIAAAGWENHGYLGDKGTGAAVGAVIGGLAGAIVGALVPAHKTIYSFSSH